jgi:hypothetical protein
MFTVIVSGDKVCLHLILCYPQKVIANSDETSINNEQMSKQMCGVLSKGAVIFKTINILIKQSAVCQFL